MAHFPTKTLPGIALLGIAEKRRRSKRTEQNTRFVIRCDVRVVYSHVITLYQNLRCLLKKVLCDMPISLLCPTEIDIRQSMLSHTDCPDLTQHARTLARTASRNHLLFPLTVYEACILFRGRSIALKPTENSKASFAGLTSKR